MGGQTPAKQPRRGTVNDAGGRLERVAGGGEEGQKGARSADQGWRRQGGRPGNANGGGGTLGEGSGDCPDSVSGGGTGGGVHMAGGGPHPEREGGILGHSSAKNVLSSSFTFPSACVAHSAYCTMLSAQDDLLSSILLYAPPVPYPSWTMVVPPFAASIFSYSAINGF